MVWLVYGIIGAILTAVTIQEWIDHPGNRGILVVFGIIGFILGWSVIVTLA